MPDFLTLTDLRNKIGAQKVDQFLADGGVGTLTDAHPTVIDVLEMAEGEAYSRMLRHYGSRETITEYANADPVFKSHVAWIACQLASERRTEFAAVDGQGTYASQYERAITYIENVSKGQLRGTGEEEAGKGANTGGKLQPKPPAGTRRQFTFASGRNAPDGHGGF